MLLAACGPPPPLVGADPPGRVRLSFFAFGDAGALSRMVSRSQQPQMRVGAVLEAEQRRRPADALVMLGDNFYPDGLLEKELEYRVRENVVRPYCVFLALDGPESSRVADACEPARRGERPIPFYAVLGNHDIEIPESPRLQREVVPRFVPNWHVPAQSIEVIELADSELQPGVSSDPLRRGRARRARRQGVAGARAAQRAADPGAFSPVTIRSRRVASGTVDRRRRSRASTCPSICISPVTTTISRSACRRRAARICRSSRDRAASARAVRHPLLGGRFALVQPGFSRVDLVGDGDAARLVVSLVALPVSSLAIWIAAARRHALVGGPRRATCARSRSPALELASHAAIAQALP